MLNFSISNNIHEDKLPQQKELSHFMLFTAPPAITSRVSLYHLRLSFLPQFYPSNHVYVRKTFLRINSLANGRVFSYSLLKILIPRFCQKVFCNDEYPQNGLISDFDLFGSRQKSMKGINSLLISQRCVCGCNQNALCQSDLSILKILIIY